jgi:hypothetical protein
MPNFWSRGLQFIEEKFGGTVTEDKDFEIILQKIAKTEKGLYSFRTVLQNFNSYIEKFCSFFTDLNNALNLIYDGSPYYIFIEEFICKQQIINNHFEDLNKLLLKLYSRTSEWSRIFESAKNQMLEREEKRKIYDHYEKKLLKIQKTSKDQKYIERNEEKYTKAASEYVEISEKIYNLMQDSLKLSWKLTNPIISELIIGEQKLFEGISSSLSCFKDNIKRFSEIEYSFNNPNSKRRNSNYDPLKYMKEKDLIKRISVRRNASLLGALNIEDGKQHKHTKFGRKNESIQKEEKPIGNLNNILSHSRLTNSFGNLSENKLEEFYNIEDDFE